MTTKTVLRPCAKAILLGLAIGFCVSLDSSVSGVVVLDFNSSNPPPPGPGTGILLLPWTEDGFTVSSSTGGASIEYLSKTGPPYMAALRLVAPSRTTTTVTIANDQSLPFDLISLNVLGVPHLPGVTNHAVLLSSMGGSITFSLPLDDSVLNLTGPEWKDLSYVQFQFSEGFGIVDLLLDDIVLKPQVVPEPSILIPGFLGFVLILLWHRTRT